MGRWVKGFLITFTFFALITFLLTYVLFDTNYGKNQIKHYLITKVRSNTPFTNFNINELTGNLPTNFTIVNITFMNKMFEIDQAHVLYNWKYNPIYYLHPTKGETICSIQLNQLKLLNLTLSCHLVLMYWGPNEYMGELGCSTYSIKLQIKEETMVYLYLQDLTDSITFDLRNGYLMGTLNQVETRKITFQSRPNVLYNFNNFWMNSTLFYPLREIHYNWTHFYVDIGRHPLLLSFQELSIHTGPIYMYIQNKNLYITVKYGQMDRYECLYVEAFTSTIKTLTLTTFLARTDTSLLDGEGTFELATKKLTFETLEIKFI